MDSQLEVVKNLCISLQNGISADAKQRKSAEEFIANLETNNGYACLLLSMISGEIGGEFINDQIKMALVITFKNFFRSNYKMNEAENLLVIPENDVDNVRKNIINVSLMLPNNLSCHLDTTIGIIAKRDFPNRWPNFLNDMVTVMTSVEVDKFTRFLKIIHVALKKYRYEFKTNDLWVEIKYVINLFGPVLMSCLNHVQNNLPIFNVIPDEFIANNQNIQNIQFVNSLIDNYHDLISQDIPDYLVDNLDVCMKLFFNILSSPTLSAALNGKNDILKNEIIKCHKKIINVIILFVECYEDDIKDYLSGFVEIIYKLALSIPKSEEYDKLNSAIIKLFLTISKRPLSKNIISDKKIIADIIANIVIPNAALRETEVESFHDEPDEYILKDMESGDLETKRKSVTELIRQLIQTYGISALNIISQHVLELMNSSFVPKESGGNMNMDIRNWPTIDVAIYLLISSAICKESPSHGPIELQPAYDINDLFKLRIMPILLNISPKVFPVLLADALKFIHIFRNYISPTLIGNVMPNIINLLVESDSKVITSYVFIVCGDLLSKTDQNNQPLSSEILGMRYKILTTYFTDYYTYFLPTQKDNIYQIQWLIKWLSYFNVNVSKDFLKAATDRLIYLVDLFDKLNVNPVFVHQCFEAICLVLWIFRCINDTQFDDIEIRILKTIISQIVQNNSNTIGYTSQVFSLFLKLFNQDTFSTFYVQNYSIFLSQQLWVCKSNVPGLCQIMNSYLVEFSSLFTNEASIRTIIDLFKYCLTLSHMDGMSVSLAKTMVVNLPYDLMKPHMVEIMSLCFKRLTVRRTYRYTKDLISFIFQFVALYGLTELKTIMDSLDSTLFSRFIGRILIVELSKPVHRPLFKKLLITLCLLILEQSLDSIITSDPYLWWSLFKCTLESVVLNKTLFTIDNKDDETQVENDVDTIDHITEDDSFNRLRYAFVSKMPFSGDVCCASKKTISLATLQQYDLKPAVQKILGDPKVNSQIVNHVEADTIQQIQVQFLSKT